MKIVVLGYILRGPLAGLTWHHVQYLLGLARLGHEVFYVEDSDDWPSCYDPQRHVTDADPTYGLAYTQRLFARLELARLGVGWAYYDQATQRWHGPGRAEAESRCRQADMVLNLSGVNPLRAWLGDVPRRVLIDTDPTFTQVRHLTDAWMAQRIEAHNHFFTFAVNFGKPGCTIPDDGFPWRPTVQPMCLDLWPVAEPQLDPQASFTTVMQWDSYASREYQGQVYGMKSMAFDPYLDLPGRVAPQTIELALGKNSVADKLYAHGWRTTNPLDVTRDPWDYQAYIRRARGEWGVAKHGYVVTNSGWFSERTCCYLALGRPAVVQDAGFTTYLPSGDGLIAFTNLEQAVAGIEDVLRRYDHHCRAARALVEEHFAAEKVLTALLRDVG